MQRLIVHELQKELTEVELYPLTDVHIGDNATDVELFEKFIDFIKESPNRYITIQGDLMNNATRNSVSNVYNDTMSPSKQKEYLIKKLRCIKDRILCIVPGNHEARSTKEVDNKPLFDIAIALEKEGLYCENGAFVKLNFGRGENGKYCSYTLYCIHGSGGGKFTGGSVNNIESFAYSVDGLDIMIMGHVHRKVATKFSKLVIDPHNNTIRQKDVLCVIPSAWQDYGGYGQRYMYKPVAKGATTILLSGKKKSFGCLV